MITTKNDSPFKSNATKPNYPKLKSHTAVRADVLVAGSGITGLTAALILQRAGKKVIIAEGAECGGGETSYSTAHMTQILDYRYHELISKFGEQQAKLAAFATRAAMDWVEKTVLHDGLNCNLEHVPSYLYTDTQKDVDDILKEIDAARRCGLDASKAEMLHPGFRSLAALSIPNQMQVNPRAYIQGLARLFTSSGGLIFENSRIMEMNDATPCVAKTEDGAVISADDMICATHTPIANKVFLHTKLAAYRTYVIGVRLGADQPTPGQYFDSLDPYHYTRPTMLPEGNIWIIGGEDHKTGTVENTEERYDRLINYAYKRFQVEAVTNRWSGQIIEPADGLPYIGKNSASNHVYVATGYAGNGTTYGTLAGMMLSDAILGIPNPYADLFKATRITPVASAANYVAENLDAVYHLIGDYLSPADYNTLRDLPVNNGGLVSYKGEKAAVFRDELGFHLFSAVCPHLKCVVHWNNSDKTFDCPCHGSRFDCKGHVINGPAVDGLKPLATKPEAVAV